jgi:hypothetical protein
VTDVAVEVTNVDTNVSVHQSTNGDGLYVVVGLKPGRYRVSVAKDGFRRIDVVDLVLNVQDVLSRNFQLELGPVSSSITVTADASDIDTADATVSTVVDRQFVENMPLNGRSFQTLITLTPGTIVTPASVDGQGQFSVNGQRSDANYFTVDGVSANTGISGFSRVFYQSGGGALPALSAVGGTNSLVSVDAMQEFRIQTSSFAPEFGRQPGAQISIVTRSGSNSFHGTAFDYFRNDVLDANDWFSNHDGLPKPKERQNDFGGVFGGPVIRDHTFFFFSYEGLRLRQPRSQETVVPDLPSRQAASPDELPYLAAFPLPNGPSLGNGVAEFDAGYSDPASLDAYGVRIDHTINSKLSVFGRYDNSPSNSGLRGPFAQDGVAVLSDNLTSTTSTQTLTLGLTAMIKPNLSNELRANYSNVRAGSRESLDNFGGAVPPPDAVMYPTGISPATGYSQIYIATAGQASEGLHTTNEQRQINLVDNIAMTTGSHRLKFGVDYRWLAPFSSPSIYSMALEFLGVTGAGGVLSGIAAGVFPESAQPVAFLNRNLSLYGQDTWKATRRLTLTYGLRWDLNPPLKGKDLASQPYTVLGLSDPPTMTLAPRGTPLYATTYGDVAPRIGLAYQLNGRPNWGAVVRGGFGIFYDIGGQSALGSASAYFPFSVQNSTYNVPLPLPPSAIAPPPLDTASPATNSMVVGEPNLKLPRTYQWNTAVEQSLGPSQTLSVTYVGAVGRNLLYEDSLFFPNPNFEYVEVWGNQATSDYHALQLKFQRRLLRGLQVVGSYTFSHSIDITSTDSLFTYSYQNTPSPQTNRGDSDFDIRHSMSGALTYDVPFPWNSRIGKSVLGGWSLDGLITARSATPVNVTAGYSFGGGHFFQPRPDLVPGEPVYLHGSEYPGGKAFNPAAFSTPPPGEQGDFGRNVLRAFGETQVDSAVQRQFKVTEAVKLRFRAEFFNIFNHPNFAPPIGDMTNPLFGLSTQTLASSLGSGGSNGGFNPLYQIGGPRSIQLALKLVF